MNTRHAPYRAQGSALIEFAVVVGMLLAMMSATWSLGRAMLEEGLIRAAADDAVQIVANTSPQELLDANAADEVIDQAEDLLRNFIDNSGHMRSRVQVECIPTCIAAGAPTRIRAEVIAVVNDATFVFFGFDGYEVNFAVEVPYAGRSPIQ